MANNAFDDIPNLEDDAAGGKGGGKGNDDDIGSLDELEKILAEGDGEFRSTFRNGGNDDDDDGFLENEPKQRKQREDEVVFDIDDDDDDVDVDDDDFGNKNRKDDPKRRDRKKDNRVQREIRLKREARENLEKAKGHIERLIDVASMAMRQEMSRRKEVAEQAKINIDNRLAYIDDRIRDATENGETGKITELTRERAHYENLSEGANKIIGNLTTEVIDNFRYSPKDIPAEMRRVPGGPSQSAQDWMDANANWFKDKKYAAEAAAAREIDKALAEEGKHKVGTEEYFLELTRRVARKFPEVEVYTADGRIARVGQRQRGGRGRQDVTGGRDTRRGDSGRRMDDDAGGNGSERVLDSESQHFLRQFGINTKDKKHLAELKENVVRTRR